MADPIKIGIMTYIRTDNYGAELQGYALQQKLNMMGFHAECINVDKVPIDAKTFRQMAIKAIVNRFKNDPVQAVPQVLSLVYKIIIGKLNKKEKTYLQSDRENAFEEFFNNAIRHTQHYTLEELYNAETDYSVLIAGSDQIWNYTRTSYLDPYFLTFAKRNQIKISYAASFSVSVIPKDKHVQYAKLLQNIDYVSVRENQGLELVKQIGGRKAVQVLDPTLLLGKNEWLQIASNKFVFDFPYILSYSLNTSNNYWKIAYSYARKNGLKIINLRHSFEKEKIPDCRMDIFDAGPREFIYLLANASMVITNSFHGTIFSINFNVPFVAVLNQISETNSRIFSILDKLSLNDRCVYDSQSCADSPSFDMSFSSANSILDIERKKSINFLLESIGE